MNSGFFTKKTPKSTSTSTSRPRSGVSETSPLFTPSVTQHHNRKNSKASSSGAAMGACGSRDRAINVTRSIHNEPTTYGTTARCSSSKPRESEPPNTSLLQAPTEQRALILGHGNDKTPKKMLMPKDSVVRHGRKME